VSFFTHSPTFQTSSEGYVKFVVSIDVIVASDLTDEIGAVWIAEIDPTVVVAKATAIRKK
jgi:hypothetical protein